MSVADLLALMDREQQTLTDQNNHSAAAIMREAASVIRGMAARLFDEAPEAGA